MCKAGRLSFATDLAEAVPERRRRVHRRRHAQPARRRPCRPDLCLRRGGGDRAAHLTGYTVVVTKSTVPVGTGRKVAGDHRAARGPDAAVRRRLQPGIPARRLGDRGFQQARPRRRRLRQRARARRDARGLSAALPARDADRCSPARRPPSSSNTRPTPSSRPRSPSSTRWPTSARRSAPTCRTWRAASASTAASAASSCMPARASAARASPRTRWRCSRPRRTAARRRASSRRSSRSTKPRKTRMAEKIIERAFGGVGGKTVAVLGLTFKPNTDDMRDAPSLVIVPALQAAGAVVRAFDPEGTKEAAKLLGGVDVLRQTPMRPRRRRRRGDADRMERVPRPRSRADEERCSSAR